VWLMMAYFFDCLAPRPFDAPKPPPQMVTRFTLTPRSREAFWETFYGRQRAYSQPLDFQAGIVPKKFRSSFS